MKKYKYSKKEQELIEQSSIPMAIYQFIDKRVVTIAISMGMCEIFGYDTFEEAYYLMDNDMYRDTHPDDVARIAEVAYRFATEGGKYEALYRTKVRDEYRIIRARGKHVYKSDGTRLAHIIYMDEGPYVENELDVDDNLNRSLSSFIREQINDYSQKYDVLTGLPSMTYFFELAKEGRDSFLEKGESPVFLFFDMSGMKNFNHKNGFSEGDKLISEVAKVLKSYFSNENCGRFGGDHFAVYTSGTFIEDRVKVLLDELKSVNQGLNLPVRVGIYVPENPHIEISIACDRAKMACDAMRNVYDSSYNFFDAEMLKAVEVRQYILDNLDRAMEEEWIKVYYQPIVRATNGKVCDEEALVRWVDPEKGMIMPSDFIQVLESANLIYKLDMYVAEHVIRKIKEQEKKGLYIVPHSINLSRSDFYTVDIVEKLRELVDDAGIERDLLTLEITESLVGNDVDYIREQVERFHELGFKVWMDDYGSGYSSPTILQKIHFDTIKFDMQYMSQFYSGNETSIILSELIKMATALGIETVVEGVETGEQVEFLREVGCSKLQGYFFCQPIPHEKVFERYEKGEQIGFENPDESDYFNTIGRLNLYDLSSSLGDDSIAGNYFNTIPINVVEYNGESLHIVRTNQSFRKFFSNLFKDYDSNNKVAFSAHPMNRNEVLISALMRCSGEGKSVFFDETLNDGRMLHLFVRHIASNPVTGVTAYLVALLAVTEPKDDVGMTFANVAQALSSDCLYFFYVDLDTEKYIEYVLGNSVTNLTIEKSGENFFAESRKDAETLLYQNDVEQFVQIFTRENVMDSIEKSGSFTYVYRLMIEGVPTYVSMKIVRARVKGNGNGIIIGVSNVDAQRRQQDNIERVRQERLANARVKALSGDFVAIYTIEPATEKYEMFMGDDMDTHFAESLIGSRGEDFFENFRKAGERVIYEEDLPLFLDSFTKEKVMTFIDNTGVFSLNIRGVVNGGILYGCIKAALIREDERQQLIVGIVDVDEQVRRDLEYANKLSAARKEVNVDALTGVKSRHAYLAAEENYNRQIKAKEIEDFGLVVFDINDLKKINDTVGHKAGDEYIKKCCGIICNIFKHSPVYRIGGDEFVSIVKGESLEHLDALMDQFREMNMQGLDNDGIMIAAGMARYRDDDTLSEVFERADARMYENKKYLKNLRKEK